MIRIIGLALAALVATGCATRASFYRVQDDVNTLRSDVTALRDVQGLTTKEVARTQADLRALQTQVAEMRTKVSETTTEAERLRTRVAVAEEELRKARRVALTPAPQPVPPPPPPAAAVPAEPRPPMPAGRVVTPEVAYNAALATFRAGEHGQAVLDFLDFAAKYPKHPLVSSAQYWIGEAYYLQRDYRQAITEFQKVPEVGPGTSKAADALLKIGMSYQGIRESASARRTWQRLVREYPSSEAATRARRLLRSGFTATR
jgi:tol-pal system protein YbgF